ncbi:hypothetical protein RFI_28197 [Reticulomyxa filosa]|uniref:Uncharacterized protein n=1 Tax=Reticulomyxa filosa TaxID=46433 RepID=X6M835_RETFI|nr:hypothetical protein RFI_28197 [Reticulomyxa filosa]|eukprot:ETO09190.1 hypothetical protein RFI_28197 [Reticulomyxa filosa]
METRNKDYKYAPLNAEACILNYALPADSNGFVSFEIVRDNLHKKTYLLALCEHNYCASSSDVKSTEKGHGRVVLFELQKNYFVLTTDNGPVKMCQYPFVMDFHMPQEIFFSGFNGLSLLYTGFLNQYNLAVVSKKDSALYIGAIDFDGLDLKFFTGGTVYLLPRNDVDCKVIFIFDSLLLLSQAIFFFFSSSFDDHRFPIVLCEMPSGWMIQPLLQSVGKSIRMEKILIIVGPKIKVCTFSKWNNKNLTIYDNAKKKIIILRNDNIHMCEIFSCFVLCVTFFLKNGLFSSI